eukprot:COSAG03_NODE_316_length_9052_cov_3.462080_10_plen_39_part_00
MHISRIAGLILTLRLQVYSCGTLCTLILAYSSRTVVLE